MLMEISATLPSLSKVLGSTHGACARRGGIKLSSVLPKLARVKWHKATGRAGQSFKFRGNIWDEREERRKELSMK